MEVLVHNVSHSDMILSLCPTGMLRPDSSASVSSLAANIHQATIQTRSNDQDTDYFSSGSENDSCVNLQTEPSVDVQVQNMQESSRGSEVVEILAKPKFSCFQPISENILRAVEATIKEQSLQGSLAPEYSRDFTRPNLDLHVNCRNTGVPIGFRLGRHAVKVGSIHNFRVRGGYETLRRLEGQELMITAVHFPLLAMLLPKWEEILRETGSQTSKKLLYLVSGAGIPRNPQHSMFDNSTGGAAKLMICFTRHFHSGIEPIQLHSGSNIFRYDDSVRFVNETLRNAIERKREKIADLCEGEWRDRFHVTISIGDGTPARLLAINASLRHYQPSYLHIWQLKTFWHEMKLSMEDIEFHSFDNVEGSPPLPLSDLDPAAQSVATEMVRHRDNFLRSIALPNELISFWLRKTKKPVLAVLLVQKSPDDPPRLFCGTNLEVSMPTGSLCAERNVIGNALASDLTLRRRDLKMIAVLSINPKISSAEIVKRVKVESTATVGTGSTVITATTSKVKTETTTISTDEAEQGSSMSRRPIALRQESPKKMQPVGKTLLAELNAVLHEDDAKPPNKSSKAESEPSQGNGQVSRSRSLESALGLPPLAVSMGNAYVDSGPNSCSGSPTNSNAKRTKRRRTYSVDEKVVIVEEDMNPLAPCGACKEWLKKIAEVNPSFRVLTFTDSSCSSVYVNLVL